MNGLLGEFMGSTASQLLIALLAAGAVAALVVSVAVVLARRQSQIERRLAGYERPPEPGIVAPQQSVGMPTTAMVQQAVDVTERLAARTSLLSRVDLLLEQADIPVRAGEALFYVPTFAVLVFLLLSLLVNFWVGLVAAAAVVLGPYAYVAYRRDQRLSKFERQLPDTLTLLAGSMRAGFSFMQGLETVANETVNPMRRELQRVFTEVRLGRSVEDALGDVAVRMKSRDLEWAVMAVRIQREVGGNLAALLDTVADTMTKRERLRREIKSLTAEGRLSAIIVAAFPPILALFLWTTQREYIETLFDESIGVVAVIGAVVLTIVGFFWLRKIVDIEV
jgi:tight adherence protein B